jgi:hypothetical protein
MNIEITSKLISSVGLLFDIAGAWFVAWEVTNQFKGQKTQIKGGIVKKSNLGHSMVDEQPLFISEQTTEDTYFFRMWELKKLLKMKIGLFLLTIGFVMQIGSSWVYLIQNNDTQKIIADTNKPTTPDLINIGNKVTPPKIIIDPDTKKPRPAK